MDACVFSYVFIDPVWKKCKPFYFMSKLVQHCFLGCKHFYQHTPNSEIYVLLLTLAVFAALFVLICRYPFVPAAISIGVYYLALVSDGYNDIIFSPLWASFIEGVIIAPLLFFAYHVT